MIPRTLQLKNFISYSSETIDFEPYNLICLSGKNGHGKSALLDALTWALWGQGRKVSGVAKADESLLKLGQNHMMVTLDFSAGNTLYRVRREYTVVGTKATAGLEFGLLDASTGSFKALTDKTIRATQDKIIDIIGLDYDSFINSAFLRQGQSHEFSKKTPKERKEILATILGLDRFELVRRAALDKIKDAHVLKETARAHTERLKTEPSNLPLMQEQLTQITAALAICSGKDTEILEQIKQLATQKQSISLQKAQAEQVNFQIAHAEKAVAISRESALTEAATWRKIAREQRNQKDFASLEKEQGMLQKELKEIQIMAARKVQLKDALISKKEAARLCLTAIQQTTKEALEKGQLLKQTTLLTLKSAQEKMAELLKKLALIDAEQARIKAEREKLAPLVEKDAQLEQATLTNAEAHFEKRKAAYHTFVTKAQAIVQQRASIAQKLELIHSTEQAQCPLCEQNADKDHLHANFMKQDSLYKHQHTRLLRVLTQLKSSLVEEHSSVEFLKKQAEEIRIAHMKHDEYNKQHAKALAELGACMSEREQLVTVIEQLVKQRETVENELVLLQKELELAHEKEVYSKLVSEANEIEATFESILYNPTRETAIHETIATISQQLSQRTALFAEAARQEERKRLVHKACIEVKELKRQLKDLQGKLTSLQGYQAAELAVKEQEEKYVAHAALIHKEKEQLIHQKGALEATIAALKLKELELVAEEKALAVHAQTADEYGAIATALSKDGIQALLIEDVIPEIEQEANDLLGRLTENQAHISIESLRDLKSGKAKETLDIKISDAVGVRPYELFSGGEAFRIDFALRIAISKLLARRSGTALQTLIIDEGFGSQDDEGLHNIMESLYTIQEDFAKIIIVSHLPAMKEQFPVHFNVTKGPDGSSVQVIEHC